MVSVANLEGKRGLALGIANADSFAAGFAHAFRDAGAELVVAYLNAEAAPFVRPMAEALGAALPHPCDGRALERFRF